MVIERKRRKREKEGFRKRIGGRVRESKKKERERDGEHDVVQ